MKVFSKKFILLCALLLVPALVCVCAHAALSARLTDQFAAARWQGESELEFVQLSAFLTAEGGKTPEDIFAFREAMLKKFDEAALETPEGGALFVDAWSAGGTLKVSSERTTADVPVIGVGGSFFTFHPMTLLSGGYLTERDLMQDRVILDRELAWKLFGGYDLAGMTIYIGETPYVIAGVVERGTDKALRKAYDEGAGLFMSYDALAKLSGTKATCYEVVMPQPVEHFAENVMEEAFKAGDGAVVVNTGRFGLWRSLRGIASFGTRSMHTVAAAYPYWENAARYYEDWCILLALLTALFLLCPLGAVCVLLVRLYRAGRDRAKAAIPAMAVKTAERVSMRLYSRGGKHMR